MSLSQKREGLVAGAVSTSELKEVWGEGNVSQGRQLGVIKGKQTRAERESFPAKFLPSSQPREGVEFKGGGREWAFSLCNFQVWFLTWRVCDLPNILHHTLLLPSCLPFLTENQD